MADSTGSDDAPDHEILVPHPYSAEDRATLADALSDLEGASVTTAETPTETRAGFESATIAITPRLPEEWLDRADALEWAQATSAGVDHYDRDAIAEREVALTNASGIHAQGTGEQVLGYLLAFERDLLQYRDRQTDGVWLSSGAGELASRTVGVVGLGAIGGRAAELAAAVGSTVIGTKRDPSTAPDAVDAVYPADELETVLARADYLVLACPLTDETRGLIDEGALATLDDDAVVVNVARGEIVEESALVEALQKGSIGGAALDVFEEEPLPRESPLWDLPNVLVTPHMAGSTPHYYDRIADLFRENYERFVADGPEGLRNRVV